MPNILHICTKVPAALTQSGTKILQRAGRYNHTSRRKVTQLHCHDIRPTGSPARSTTNIAIVHPAVEVTSPTSKVWFVTGTSSGFGRRLVSILLARGERVIATAKTLSKMHHFFENPALDYVPNLHCAELDIASGTARVKERIDDIIQASGWGTVDVLVNNAGFAFSVFVEEGGYVLFDDGRVIALSVPDQRVRNSRRDYGNLAVHAQTWVSIIDDLIYVTSLIERSGTVVVIGSRSTWRTELEGLGFYGSSKAALHAISETMAVELEPFGIRMLIVKPSSFRTEGIYRNDFDESNAIPDYDDKRGPAAKVFAAPKGKQPGDPVKAMKALVEVVRGEGRAAGKTWPLYLVLGKDAERDVRKKCAMILSHLDEWGDIIRDVDFDDLDESIL